MGVALFFVIPALLATWVSYWSTGLFSSLLSRASKIACLVMPTPLAIIEVLLIGLYLGSSGIDVKEIDLSHRYVIGSLVFGATTLLVIPTLLLASLTGRVAKSIKNRE